MEKMEMTIGTTREGCEPLDDFLRNSSEGALKLEAGVFPDPYGHFQLEEVWTVFESKIANFPEQVVFFGLQAIESRENFGAGMHCIDRVIQKIGWDHFFFIIKESNAGSALVLRDPSRLYEIAIECIYQLSNPSDLSTDKIEEFLKETKSDLEWIKLSSYISTRKQVENVDEFSPELCRDILREKNIPFWNVEKSREVAERILNENYEAYVGLMEELRFYYRESSFFRNNQEEKEQLAQWRQMSKKELLKSIYPVYAFNVVTKYYPDDADEFTPEALSKSKKGEIIRSIILSDDDLRNSVRTLVQTDPNSFQRIFFEKEVNDKVRHIILSNFRGRDLISPLEKHVAREKKSEVDSWGYIVNSAIVDVAQGYSCIFSPSGKFLEVVKSSGAETENKRNDHKLAASLRMAHILSDGEIPLEERSAAIMLLFWHDLPEDMQEEIEAHYGGFGVDIGSFVEACPDSFELALSFTQDIQQLLPEWFSEWITEYVATQYESSRDELSPVQTVDIEKIIRDIVAQVGKMGVEKESMVRSVSNFLSFSSVRFLSEKLNFDISKVTLAEFFSLLVFLHGNHSGEGFKKIENLFGKTENESCRSDRIKSFLSFYQGGAEMGEKILAIGEKLPKEAADRVFAKYAEMVDASREEAKKIHGIYKEIFPPDTITEEKIAGALLANANMLLRDMSDALVRNNDAESILTLSVNLIDSLEKNNKARSQVFGEFLVVSESLTAMVKELESEYLLSSGAFDSREHEREFAGEAREAGKKFLAEKFGEDSLKQVESLDSEMREWEKHNQNEVIRDMLQEIEREYANTQEMLEVLGHHDIAQRTAEKLKMAIEENVRKFQPITKKLTEILKQRKRMERKFEEILYQREPAILPREFFSDFENRASHIQPEMPPSERFAYFPVGISKDLPQWERVLSGKGRSAKPIDLYNFLFWLNNQERPIMVPVCDETQAWNYETLYGKTREEALEMARAVGKVERERYQAIVQTFGLKNVRVVSYKEFFLDTEEKSKRFEKYRTLLTRISTTGTWAKAFENMVGDSVSGKSTELSKTKEEKEKLFPYAIEEIALLLTARGMKVSHPNEARYDVIAAVLENLEKYAKENNIDFFDPDQHEQLQPALRSILKALGDRLNNPRKEERSICGKSYINAAQVALKSIRREEKGRSIFTKQEEKTLSFNFFPASPDSRSFGWRSAGTKGEEERLTFKEPYSTYYPSSEAELLLEDQVVAVPEGIIAGKILTLSAEKQNEYAEEVLRPLLAHYFKSLESAPQSYFQSVGETRGSLLELCRKSETLGDLLRFIQKYIVAPSVERAGEGSPAEKILA